MHGLDLDFPSHDVAHPSIPLDLIEIYVKLFVELILIKIQGIETCATKWGLRNNDEFRNSGNHDCMVQWSQTIECEGQLLLSVYSLLIVPHNSTNGLLKLSTYSLINFIYISHIKLIILQMFNIPSFRHILE